MSLVDFKQQYDGNVVQQINNCISDINLNVVFNIQIDYEFKKNLKRKLRHLIYCYRILLKYLLFLQTNHLIGNIGIYHHQLLRFYFRQSHYNDERF